MVQSTPVTNLNWSRAFSRLALGVGLSCSLAIGSAVGQSSQDATGSGVNIGGDNSGFINTGSIKFILQSEAKLTDSPEEQRVLKQLAETLSSLAERGEISVSETGVRMLARNTIGLLANQSLTRDVIEQRQFAIPYQQTYNIAGTNNRISYIRNNCGANLGITFRFNNDEHCWYGVGGGLKFASGGSKFELVFDGYNDAGSAKFTIYPAN